MRPGGVEALRAALRRSLWLIALLVAVGVATVNTMRQLQGPQYAASAQVLLTGTNDLAYAVTGIQPPYQDPQRLDDAELSLANSPQFYDRVAERTGGSLGSGSAIRAVTGVSGGSNALTFSASTDDPARAARIADAVASAYPGWRGDVIGASVDNAIAQLRAQIATVGRSTTLNDQLTRLTTFRKLISGNAILVEHARSATKTRPAPVKDSILGASIGLVIALLLVGAREAFDTTVRSEADIEELLDIPVLATIGTLPRRARLVMFGRNEERYGDTYALLASNLARMRKDSERTIIAVTSATAGEGKTTTASNLAVAFARRGADVLIADFDVRKPSLGDIFRIPRDALGVAQVIGNDADLEEALWTVTLNGSRPTAQRAAMAHALVRGRETGPDGPSAESLRLLPAGGSVPVGTVAHSPQLPELLADLSRDTDVLILDTPPALLTVEMAELSRHVDVVLIVVRQGKVTRRTLRALSRQSQSWPPKTMGAVFTDALPDESYSYYRG